ncbi:MAG: TIGR01777 family oxidoreductase [Planctomycetota bacterium]
MPLFEASSAFDCDQHQLFAYHQSPGAIDRLIPPWEDITVLSSQDSLEVGSKVVLENRMFGLRLKVKAIHVEYEPERLFVDSMEQGPFRRWLHRHQFDPIQNGGSQATSSRLTDHIEFELPLAPVSHIALPWLRSKLAAMFAYRHQVTRDDITALQQLKSLRGSLHDRPRIGITGSSGLVGQRTLELASVMGCEVVRILRRESKPRRQRDPTNVQSAFLDSTEKENSERLEGLDAVIHLAGAGIGDRRWTLSAKQAIYNSRIDTTQQLVHQLQSLARPPRSLVSVSGIGIFGDRATEVLDEYSQPAPRSDFLSSVAQDWESAANGYESTGRVAIARLGVVLHPRLGALPKLLTPMRLGLGGPIGNGKQFWPWIHVDDAANTLLHLAFNGECHGPYHAVSPEAATNRTFMQTLGHVLHRPSLLPMPTFAIKVLLGEMAEPLLLASTHVTTDRLLGSGYRFRFPDLRGAFQNLLGLQGG